jgi:acyl dehydratase
MAEGYRPRGLYFEELEVGKEIITPGRTITEADIVNFAGVSGDFSTLHVDAEYARGTIFGERVAHGMLGLSVATGLTAQLGILEGTVMAFTGVKQTKAMRAASGGFVVLDVQVVNQRGESVQQGEWSVMVKGKGTERV